MTQPLHRKEMQWATVKILKIFHWNPTLRTTLVKEENLIDLQIITLRIVFRCPVSNYKEICFPVFYLCLVSPFLYTLLIFLSKFPSMLLILLRLIRFFFFLFWRFHSFSFSGILLFEWLLWLRMRPWQLFYILMLFLGQVLFYSIFPVVLYISWLFYGLYSCSRTI